MTAHYRKMVHLILLAIFINIGIGSNAALAMPQNQQGANIYTFSDFGVDSDIILRGPFETRRITFDLPPNWVLQEGTVLTLEIGAFFAVAGDDGTNALDGGFSGALLEVYFNDGLQQSVPLLNSPNATYTIPILVRDLISTRGDGAHSITLALDAALDCDLDFHRTTIAIKNTSSVVLPYTEAALDLDLRRLPWPIYQARVNAPSSVFVVLPDSPSADVIQAGLITMGAFGRMTSGRLPMSMILISQITESITAQSDLIFVGQPSAFGVLSDLSFPLDVSTDGFVSTEVRQDDGVLQIVPSPWNGTKSVLMISGDSDAGIVKAAQALASGSMLTGMNSAYSVIAQVAPFALSGGILPESGQAQSPELAFSSLGYTATTFNSVGLNYFTYEFTIPPGLTPSETPYVEFRFSNSSLLDPFRSGIEVALNDIVVGSLQFTEETSTLSTARVDLPLSVLRSGTNRLDLVIGLLPLDACSVTATTGLWTTIFPDSYIYLPLVNAPDSPALFRDLTSYPYPFATDASFARTTFVLPGDDFGAWTAAGKIAYDLGARVEGPILSFEAAFDGEVNDLSKDGHLIIVGEPRDLTILSELRDAIPAYFEENSNVAVLETQLVTYRISDEKSLGYLEIFVSPWSSQAAVLGVFGTNPDGLNHAVNSIVNFQIRETLSGNFSTYDGGNRAIVVDTRTGLGMGRLEAGLGSETVSLQPTTISEPHAQESAPLRDFRPMLIYGIAGVLIAMVFVAIVALRFGKKRSQ